MHISCRILYRCVYLYFRFRAGKEGHCSINPNNNKQFDGKIDQFPQLAANQTLVCAFNQWGMEGMAKMYECYSLKHMQALYDAYSRGSALSIKWYAMSDMKPAKQKQANDSAKSNDNSYAGLKKGFLNK